MATKCAVYEIGGHVDRAIAPTTSVLKVLDLVYELQDSLQIDPRASALFIHLVTIKRLQGALKLLADNCRLVILWLEDVVQILKDSAAANDDWYLVRVSNVMNILVKLQLFCQDEGGVLSSTFDRLEIEYRRLLTETDFSHSSIPQVGCVGKKKTDFSHPTDSDEDNDIPISLLFFTIFFKTNILD
ncbi:hypothetical protein C2S51_037756 [Perilla frutescens var. frutescens]|nr:hypothetical protein C2S51_037756 [Perilla frutescens var. frutescens]